MKFDCLTTKSTFWTVDSVLKKDPIINSPGSNTGHLKGSSGVGRPGLHNGKHRATQLSAKIRSLLLVYDLVMVKLSSQLYSKSTGGQKVAEDMSDRLIKNPLQTLFLYPPSPTHFFSIKKKTSGVYYPFLSESHCFCSFRNMDIFTENAFVLATTIFPFKQSPIFQWLVTKNIRSCSFPGEIYTGCSFMGQS